MIFFDLVIRQVAVHCIYAAMDARYLHQSMLVAGHPGGLAVTVMDGDTISPSNTVRQSFCTSQIGLNKPIVTVSGLNLFWGLNWTAQPEHLRESTDIGSFDLVIGCVDTRAARLLTNRKVEGTRSRGGA